MVRPDASVVEVPGPWQHRAVAANGARFHVAECGSGPLVLLLHGFPEFWWAWRHQLVSLAGVGYRAAAMDLRGYGGSDKPPRGYDPVTLAGDVAGVIRSLGEPAAVVVGHGWGGLLGWTLAVHQPRLVRRLVVVATAHPRRLRRALLTAPRQAAAGRHALVMQPPWLPERALVEDGGATVPRLLQAWAAPGWPDAESVRRYRQAVQIPGVAHCAAEYYRWAVRSIPRPDGLRYARRMRQPVQVPVLQLHGSADRALLPSTAAGSGRYVAGPYRWRLLDGVGHFPHEEAPERFDLELLRWLADREVDR